MQQNQTRSQRFEQYQVSKTALFWSCAGCAILATIVGFTWGGWVTGGGAQEMVEDAVGQARQEMASVVCVDRFMAAPDAEARLTTLKEASTSYAQSSLIEDGGWAVILPVSDPVDRAATANDRKAAALCAADLVKHEVPVTGKASQINNEATIVQ